MQQQKLPKQNEHHQQQQLKHQQQLQQQTLHKTPSYPAESKVSQTYLKRSSDHLEKKQLAATKLARLDTWKQTIDQQIEKRFSSYLSQIAVNGEKKPPMSSGVFSNGPEQKQNGADKRVLSILRNSLETKEARNQLVQQQKPVPPAVKYESSRPPTAPVSTVIISIV